MKDFKRCFVSLILLAQLLFTENTEGIIAYVQAQASAMAILQFHVEVRVKEDFAYIPESFASNYIINCRYDVIVHFNMEALHGRTNVNCELFEKNPFVYLHCCTTHHSFEVKVKGLPFLSLKLCYCHISFMNSLAERRVCVIPHCATTVKKLEGVKSPCVIEVLSSVLYEIDPEEVEEEEDSIVLMIWDFKVSPVLSASATAVRPLMPREDKMTVVPLLDYNKCMCNCSSHPRSGLVLIEGNVLRDEERVLQDLDVVEDRNEEEDDGTQENDNTANLTGNGANTETHSTISANDLFTEIFQLKGSSYHSHFQTYLRTCKFQLLSGSKPDIRCHLEPTNKRDENAVVVQALLNSEWRPLGYIPAKKVPKVNIAFKKDELVEAKLNNVVYQFVHSLNEFMYFPVIQLVKVGKWLPDSKEYIYYDYI